ncbi:MAG: hypothetical protein QF876_11600 [Desulfobacterales bacterium]|nr:hypothetical protein [Desulfobacterales bacterium]MDP6806861.1 hypothetical protein [Desulfobacterales bacterium]
MLNYRKWLSKAEEWSVINGEEQNGTVVYSPDDVTIGRVRGSHGGRR